MASSQNDIELLDTYLDGELGVEQCEALWRRLAEEPELAAELEHCRGDRAVRQMVFGSMEPTELAVAALQSKMGRVARRQDVMSIVSRSMRAVVAAAACILFGFGVGWMGHDKYTVGSPGGGTVQAVSDGRGGGNGDGGSGTGKFIVNIQDDSGRVVATKQFDTSQEAHEFADDVARSQARHRDVHDSPVIPVSDQF